MIKIYWTIAIILAICDAFTVVVYSFSGLAIGACLCAFKWVLYKHCVLGMLIVFISARALALYMCKARQSFKVLNYDQLFSNDNSNAKI